MCFRHGRDHPVHETGCSGFPFKRKTCQVFRQVFSAGVQNLVTEAKLTGFQSVHPRFAVHEVGDLRPAQSRLDLVSIDNAFLHLIQQLDGNIIGPKILGDSIGIGAMWVLIAVVVCGGFFGVGGMVLGVPAVAVLYSLTKQASEKRLKKKNMPSSTEFYKNDPPKENTIDPDLILIAKDTPVPDITADMDVPASGNEKKLTFMQRIKNNINSKKKKGEKK